MDLDELVARAEIRDAILRYCRGIDRGDLDLIRSAYHPGAIENHGAFVGSAEDFAPYTVARSKASGLAGHHTIANMTFQFDGDAARVETYYVCLQPYRDENDEPDTALIFGRYLDAFARIEGRWAITAREVVNDGNHAHFPDTPWFGIDGYVRSAGGR